MTLIEIYKGSEVIISKLVGDYDIDTLSDSIEIEFESDGIKMNFSIPRNKLFRIELSNLGGK